MSPKLIKTQRGLTLVGGLANKETDEEDYQKSRLSVWINLVSSGLQMKRLGSKDVEP